jgi:hypothetical protein
MLAGGMRFATFCHTKGGETPRQDWRGVSLVLDQWMVNGAEAATSYGVVVFLFNWTT